MTSLADSLELVRPWLAADLTTPASFERLRAAARQLPAVHRAGFECRLEHSHDQVDLQQGILAEPGEPAALHAFLDGASRADNHHRGWRAAQSIARAWQEPGSLLAGAIRELWLEVDLPNAPQSLSTLAPSLFVSFQRHGSEEEQEARIRAAISLLSERPGPVITAAAAWGRALPAGAWISHLGAMLGREPQGMRIHLSDLPQDELETALEAIGWPGDRAAVSDLAGELFEIVDSIIFCLEVGSTISPKLGLECVLLGSSHPDRRLPWLLDQLVTKGLCTPAKRDSLLAWPGKLFPGEMQMPWPDELIVAGLLKPGHQLGFLHRRWSHVKLTWQPAGAVTAKAYFGFQHAWLNMAKPALPEAIEPRAQAPSLQRAAQHVSLENRLLQARDRTIRFLGRSRSQSGFWREFFTVAPSGGPGRELYDASDEWVTGYVGWALATTGDADAILLARQAWNRLLSRRKTESGWGYHARTAPDADSTCWTLRLARSLGISANRRLAEAAEFVLSHECAGGGISCYRLEDSERLTREWQYEGPWHGWCSPTAAITAGAATIGLGTSSFPYLISNQTPNGSWDDYWWADDEVPTALAVEALLERSDTECRAALERALRWTREQIGSDGSVHESPFATALCVQALARAGGRSGHPEPPLSAMEWLVASQREDGSFPASARLLAPLPQFTDKRAGSGEDISSVDHDAIYTTATALAGLNAVLAGRWGRLSR